MKPLSCFLLALSLGLGVAQAELPPILVKAGKPITQPDLKAPLGPEWSVGKGKWEPKDGVIVGNEIPEEHHAAVLHLKTGPTSLVFEAEFKMDTAKVFYIGCDSTKHVGRLVVVPKSAKLAEDSGEVKGKTPSNTLAETAVDIKPDEWVPVRVEYTGDQIVARVGADHELKAQNPYLATPKVRWWIAAGGGQIEVRNIRVSEGEPAN
jgi:hypothetical protein